MFLSSCHVFNFDCGFTHVSHTRPERKFNSETNGTCCKLIGITTIERYVKGLRVSLPKKVICMARFGLTV